MEKATDFFKYGEMVEIVTKCPLRGLEGELVYVSDDSLQIEVSINYEGFENCSSYFRGFVKDIGKIL